MVSSPDYFLKRAIILPAAPSRKQTRQRRRNGRDLVMNGLELTMGKVAEMAILATIRVNRPHWRQP
jgi:hypothetical protein